MNATATPTTIVINEVRMGRNYRITVSVEGSTITATYEYSVDPTEVHSQDFPNPAAALAHMDVIRVWWAEQECDTFKVTAS